MDTISKKEIAPQMYAANEMCIPWMSYSAFLNVVISWNKVWLDSTRSSYGFFQISNNVVTPLSLSSYFLYLSETARLLWVLT